MAETRRSLRALGRVAFAAGLLALGASPAHGATFTVTSTVDAADIGVGDGLCSAIVGVLPDPPPLFVFGCTLRAALQEANFAPGADTIIVPAGSFTVALAVTAVDDAGGDLDITDDVVITGAGSASTILDASALPAGQPALAITDPAPADANPVELLLAGVTIADAPAKVYDRHQVRARRRGDPRQWQLRHPQERRRARSDHRLAHRRERESGLFSVWGDLEIANSVVENNGGGGILNLRGALTVTDSTIRGNTGSDGGIRQQGTSLHVVRTTIHDNHSTNRGGGLSIQGGGPNVIRDTTFSANSTTADGGAISTYAPSRSRTARSAGTRRTARRRRLRIGFPGHRADRQLHDHRQCRHADASAGGQGGGIAQDYGSEIRVADSVLANNTAAPAAGRDCAGSIDSQGYNVVRIDDCGGFGAASRRSRGIGRRAARGATRPARRQRRTHAHPPARGDESRRRFRRAGRLLDRRRRLARHALRPAARRPTRRLATARRRRRRLHALRRRRRRGAGTRRRRSERRGVARAQRARSAGSGAEHECARRIGVPATIRATAASARDGRAAVAQLIRWPRTL